METEVYHVIKLGTSIQKKLESRLLVLEEHDFIQCALCAPGQQEVQKCLACIGLTICYDHTPPQCT